jgi:hypothetical protein
MKTVTLVLLATEVSPSRRGLKLKLIFYTMMAEVIHFQRVAILKTA